MRRWVATAFLALAAANASAQAPAPAATDAERLAREGITIGSRGGAGGDVQTSVAQPVFSAGRAAEVTTSVQGDLGAFGDPGGYRAFLQAHGIVFDVIHFGDVYGNVRGGLKRGSTTMGLVDSDLDIDLHTLAGWQGGAIHATYYGSYGRGASRTLVGNLLTVSDIEAISGSRLNELWFEQSLFDNVLAIRVGQLATDTEYMVSQTAILFANGSFGWPAIFGSDQRGGGPAYPLAVPGVRAKITPNANLSFQAGIYDGDPGGRDRFGREPDPQRRNRDGLRFPLSDPAFAIGEVSYAYNITPGSRGEPGTATLGGWYELGRFDAIRRARDGTSLADPDGSGIARRLRGNSGVYGVVDQTIYREPGDPNDGASAFVRASASPSERNLIDLYLDAGLAYRGFFPGRSDDTMGLSVGVARLSQAARKLDVETIAFTGTPRPRRSTETVVEGTYQVVLGPGIAVQPTVQYVFNPSGGIANPLDPNGARIRNAAVLGLRSVIRY